MTTQDKLDLANRLKTKVKELNDLIRESNKELQPDTTRLNISRLNISIKHQELNTSSVRGYNKYITCTISETVSY